MVDRRENNLKTLNDANDIQNKTKEAIWYFNIILLLIL